MRITNEVYLVGGGPSSGFGLTDDPDCHVYLIDAGDELALIDCGMGMGNSIARIKENIRAEGLDPNSVRHLLLTHYHIDHAGGAARVQDEFDVTTYAPRDASTALRTADERAVSFDVAKRAGFYPSDYQFVPCTVDRELVEGDRIQIGPVELRVFDTPGHCSAHVSYLMVGRNRRYLFAGDAVFYDGRIVLQNIHDCSIQASRDSVLKLAELNFDTFLPGHRGIAVTNGRQHVEAAAQAFRQLFVPKSLFA